MWNGRGYKRTGLQGTYTAETWQPEKVAKPMRLLVVEDNDQLADLICKGLKAAGFDSDRAARIADAEDAIQASSYGAMIVDLGPIFVLAKFITAPLAAFLLWQAHQPWMAAVALLWPWVGPPIAGIVLIIPSAVLTATSWGERAQIGSIQRHLLTHICNPIASEYPS